MDSQRDQYLQGKLSDDESARFEASLSEEERQELAIELGIRDGLNEGFREEIKEQLKTYESKRTIFGTINPIYYAAAVLVLVVGVTIVFNAKDNDLFSQNYEVYPNYELTTVRGSDAVLPREQAYQAYDLGDYDLAIVAFNQMEALTTPDYFFRGLCYIETKKFDLAISDLQSVQDLDGDYRDAASWYLSIVLVQQERYDEAKLLLEKLTKNSNEYSKESEVLLKKLQ